MEKQEGRLAKHKPGIIVGTPGWIWALLNEFVNQSFFECIPQIWNLVLDEADRLIEIGHYKELTKILNFIYSHWNSQKLTAKQMELT